MENSKQKKLTDNDKLSVTAITIFTCIILFLVLILPNIKTEKLDNRNTSNENDFLELIKEARQKYYNDNKSKDAKIEANARDSLLAEKMQNQNFEINDWNGRIHSLYTDENGNITLSILIGTTSTDPITLTNSTAEVMLKNSFFNQPFRDAYENNKIMSGDALHDSVSKLSVGDDVVFSGRFSQTTYQHTEKRIEEVSFSGSGQMDAPEYMFVFTKINPRY